MNKYECTLIYDASSNATVEADSVEAAIDAAYEHDAASLCHQCSRNLDLGDIIGVLVYKDGEEVADTTHRGEQIATLRAEKADLLKALEVFANIEIDSASEIVPNGYSDPQEWRNHVLSARAAIAKSRGENHAE